MDSKAFIRRLLQGQRPAERIFARATQAPASPTSAEQPAASGGGTEAPAIDPEKLAWRVQELMRRDLLAEQARRGITGLG